MIRPEDLQNRVVIEAPTARVAPEPEPDTDDEHAPSAPGDPCPPSQPSTLEHGERKGGNPDLAGQ